MIFIRCEVWSVGLGSVADESKVTLFKVPSLRPDDGAVFRGLPLMRCAA